MSKRISAVLLAIITGIFAVIVVCWPSMHPAQIDCPDAHSGHGSSFSVPPPSCFALHLEGIDMFNRAIISMASLVLLFWTLIVFSIVRGIPFLFQKNTLTLFIHGSPPYIPRKRYRWLAKHFSLYHSQYS